MALDIETAGLAELEAEFQRLVEGRKEVFATYQTAWNNLDAQLDEYQEIYGRVEVIDALVKSILGEETPSDEDLDDLPSDELARIEVSDWLDISLAAGGALVSFGSFVLLARKIRAANAVVNAVQLADDVALNAAAGAAVRWPKLQLLGGAIGLGASIVGIALLIENHNERKQFYRTNIQIYRDWATDLEAEGAKFDTQRGKLDADLDDLQEKLGFASRAEMKNELRRSVGDVAEYRSQWIALTKMLCNNISVADATNYTGFPSALVQRRAQEIASDPTICPAFAA